MTKSWPGRSATRPWCDWPCRVLKHCTSNTRSGAARCIPTVRCKPSRGGPRNSERLTPTVCASRFRSEGLRGHVGEGKAEVQRLSRRTFFWHRLPEHHRRKSVSHSRNGKDRAHCGKAFSNRNCQGVVRSHQRDIRA